MFNLVHYDSYPYGIYAMTNTTQDSQLVHGVSFKKTFSYAGFEMQPKKYITPKVRSSVCTLSYSLALVNMRI